MEFVPDYKKAREQNKEPSDIAVFETYSPAYVVTNENLRQLPQLMPKKHENVLTVVGSGDHPLWFSLYGAKHVDTFDISYNAKILMDIKVVALNCLSRNDYNQLLDDFYEINRFPFKDISSIKNMSKILPKLPEVESEYIKKIESAKIFRTNWKPLKSTSLPNFLEYIKLRIQIKKPYNFYMTDIRNLSNFLTTSYDVIHLSNILDYVPRSKHKAIILPLLNHINPGGRLIAHTMIINPPTSCFKTISNSLDKWKYIQKPVYIPLFDSIISKGTHILERIR